jgi:hypothetical protein
VAPIIKVRVPNRGLVDMVLDPSLAGGPISVDEWTRLMNPEPFERLSLEQLRALAAENQGRLPVDRRFTFVANRYTYNPTGAINPSAPGAAESAYQADRARLRGYAELAEVHELAAAIRGQLGGPSTDVPAILAAIRAATPRARSQFQARFPNLYGVLMNALSASEAAQVRAELARP